MTDLLSSRSRRTAASAEGRPVVLPAVAGGVVPAAAMLMVTGGVALVGWITADAGRYGDARDAMRVGADAWLLAHGADLHLDGATVALLPLGLTLLCAFAAHRSGAWVGSTVAVDARPSSLPALLSASGVQATAYATVALATAVVSIHPRAEADLFGAFTGAFVLCLLSGGSGILVGSGQARALLSRAPAWGRSTLTGAAAVLLVVLATSSALVAGALVADFGTAATVLSRLHADGPGGLMYTVVGLLFVPNAVLLGASYLLGPGFAVGAGTVVSPTAVVLGPVPAFPLLAALPGDGATPAWTTALMGLPVVAALGGVLLAARVAPPGRLDTGAAVGLASGLLAAGALTLLVGLAGGAAGPGRMADVGAPLGETFLAAAVALGGGGLVGGVLAAWRARRTARDRASTSGPARG